MDQKAIFLDIDGTLVIPGTNVPPASAQEAIRRAREKGHKVFLCTGRNYGMLSPLLPVGFDGFVGSSGGYIEIDGEAIYNCPMTPDQQNRARAVLTRNGVYQTIEGKLGSYSDNGFKELLLKKIGTTGNSEFLRWREQLEKELNIRSMSCYDGEPLYKIVFVCESEDCLVEPIRELGGEFNFCIQEPDMLGLINGELVNKKFDKGTGLKLVCQKLGIPVENSIGFGDSMNDLEMMEAAGYAVCMANGSAKLKELADEVCPAPDQDGIYLAFEKLGLI